ALRHSKHAIIHTRERPRLTFCARTGSSLRGKLQIMTEKKITPLSRLIVCLGIPGGICVILFSILRVTGLLRPFSIPSDAMLPAVSKGDHVMMEGISFLARNPRRGDIVVFSAEALPTLPPDQMYLKRVVGL